MTVSKINWIALTAFRSHQVTRLNLESNSTFLVGLNGAGKTNLLEAVSLLSPGKGLRGASLSEMGYREPGETLGRAWAIAAEIEDGQEGIRLGTGLETAQSPRRTVRIGGQTEPPVRLTDYIRPMWMTPAQDRLFLDGASERRRFFDRLVFAARPDHAAEMTRYERAMRERLRLLTADVSADAAWLSALESQMAQSGAFVAAARIETLAQLQAAIDQRHDRPFPRAILGWQGEWERLAFDLPIDQLSARLADALSASRGRDAMAGRSLVGPHRGDFEVQHAEKNRPASECSTGEQKALILNLVLAQSARLSRAESAPEPILLLDEVAAHLDHRRREALADEIQALGLQVFLTGTDASLFAAFRGQALGFALEPSGLVLLDT